MVLVVLLLLLVVGGLASETRLLAVRGVLEEVALWGERAGCEVVGDRGVVGAMSVQAVWRRLPGLDTEVAGQWAPETVVLE